MARHIVPQGLRVPATVVGLDVSLTGTGMVLLPPSWAPGSWKGVRSWYVGRSLSKRALGNDKAATALDRVLRLQYIVDTLVDALLELPVAPTHLWLEDYAFAAMQAHTRSVAELTGVIKLAMFENLKLIAQPVASTAWRKLLLGYGRKKDIKQIAQAEIRLAGGPFESGDCCDGFGVANFGRSELGLSALTLA